MLGDVAVVARIALGIDERPPVVGGRDGRDEDVLVGALGEGYGGDGIRWCLISR